MIQNRMVIALMEEYQKVAIEYKEILKGITQAEFERIADEKTKDPDCKSIQTVTFHIIQSGYTYSNYINTVSDEEWLEYESPVDNPIVGIEEIDKMLDYAEKSLSKILDRTNDEIGKWTFKARWGTIYDFEQLMEHAIVHILRHRRQIEHFLN